MSLNEIERNIDKLEDQKKEDLVRYVHELLINKKKQESKVISLRTEIKFLNRHMMKIKELIDKTLNTSVEDDSAVWKNKK